MKREDLKALGLAEDVIDKIMEENGKDIEKYKGEAATAKASAEQLKTQLTDRDKQLDELKKVDPAALQAEITKLQTANTTAQAEHEKALSAAKLNFALEARLMKEGAVSTKAVKALLDPAKISLDGENLIGIDEQLKALKETEKWAFGEQQPSGSTGMPHGTPPPAYPTVAMRTAMGLPTEKK
jgi:hypothetical protein